MNDHPPDDLSDIWEDAPPPTRQSAPARRQVEPSPRRITQPRPRRTQAPRRRWRTPLLGYVALVLGCVAVAAVAFLVVAAPVDLFRDRLVAQVKARTGYNLAIGGPASLSFFPRPGLSLGDVSLAAPESAGAPPILVVPALEAHVSLWSLITGSPRVDSISLHQPTIEFAANVHSDRGRPRTDEQGDRGTGQADRDAVAQQQPSGGASPTQGDDPLPAVPVSSMPPSIRIVEGTVRYRDASGSQHEIQHVSITLASDAASRAITINGTMSLRDAPVTIAGTVSPIPTARTTQPSQVAFKVAGGPLEGTFDGTFSVAGGLSADGKLNLRAVSVRALGEWLGQRLPAAEDNDAFALRADVKAAQGSVTLSNLQGSLGAATLAGSLALETQQPRRRVTGNLQLSELDFGRLLMKPGRDQVSLEKSSAPPAVGPAPAPTARQARAHGWHEDPIDLSLLRLLDANLKVSAGRLVHKDIKTGPARFSLSAEGGVARIALEEVEFYGGRARGLLTLDGSGDTVIASNNIILNRVALRPLLADALEFPWLEGNGNIYLQLAGQGLTERQIVESLNGKVEMTSSDGAIVGLDVGKIVRSLQHARLPSFSPSPDEKTPYAELSANFNVTNGVAKNQDLKLVSPHLQLNGEGTLELGSRQIDYTVRAKLGGSAPEPDATIKIGTIEVPVSIVGPWERPTFGIKGQEQLTGTLKQIRKNLKSQDVKDAVKDLLQGDGEKRVKPRELIDKLLKKD